MKYLSMSGALFFMIFMHDANSFSLKPVLCAHDFIRAHPFATAAALVIALNNDPIECIKEIGTYFIEEHPIICIIIIGFLLSFTYSDLLGLQMICKIFMGIASNSFHIIMKIIGGNYHLYF